LVEVKFKPADVGTVADGAITTAKLADEAVTNAKVKADAAIAKAKLAPLAIVDDDVSAISVAKVTDAVAGTGTTGDKKIIKMGWNSATEEIIVDHEA
jgi:hypothetical protein